ncbi:MAG: hypothetical protein PHR83_06480 [Paludibacter sp.]|nr:hypothetical protein [Paludibacter sp.]
MKKKSDFMTIGGTDLLNALYHAIIASAIPFAGFLSAGRMPTQSEWYIIMGATLSAFIGALFKRGATNSQGELFTKEPQSN